MVLKWKERVSPWLCGSGRRNWHGGGSEAEQHCNKAGSGRPTDGG